MARVPLTPFLREPRSGLLDEGVFLASRSLDQAAPSPRTASARAAYALRAGTRTTPNGVWCAAGVAVLDGPEQTRVRSDGRYRVLTLPAPAWLLAVADCHVEVALPQLAVTANNLAVCRGGRWEAVHRSQDGDAVLGSVASTELSDWLLSECGTPVPARQLIDKIQARYPAADETKARTAIVHLVRTGLLLTDLLPEDLRADPLQHLVQRLGQERPEVAPLADLRSLLRRADQHPPGSEHRLGLLRQARGVADRLHTVDRPFTVDTAMDTELHLPATVGARAAEAASVLWRIGHRTGPLETWTRRFTELFGRHRLVPLLEAIDPVMGVGPPTPEDSVGARSGLDDARARYLTALYTEALAQGLPEIALTCRDVLYLEAAEGPEPPYTAEIHVRVICQPDGTLNLVVGPHAAQDAGSASARFRHLLPELIPTTSLSERDAPVMAEIACRPLTARTAALATPTEALPHRIPVGVPPRGGDLLPTDLAIASTGNRLILWSRQLDAPVRPVLLSRITRELIPPAAQLLYLLGHDGERPWHPFTWAPVLPHASYTPRVTYRGTVFLPQRWRLPDGLIAAAGRRTDWVKQLDDWLTRVQPSVPTLVLAEESDRHLLIDLTEPQHQEILRRTVSAGARTIAEALGYFPSDAPVESPHGRHLLELVVPLDRRHSEASIPVPDPRTAVRPRRSDETGATDGWISVALAVPVRHQNAVLQQLPIFHGARLGYWLRYRTPSLGHHVRVRVRAENPADLAPIREMLGEWAALLADQRLSDGLLYAEPYVRETQRYGGPDAIEAAEAVFSSDSDLACWALEFNERDRLILASGNIQAIAAVLAPGQALRAVSRASRLSLSERRLREEARTVAREHQATLPATKEQTHRAALTELADRLQPHIAPRVASDVIHMHCNRLLGLDSSAERIARSLALDLLYRE